MHDGEFAIDAGLVADLVAEQFPAWGALPVVEVSGGTSNAMFRLGDDLVVRLPRTRRTSGDVVAEQRWLPQLIPLLPTPTPRIVAAGEPAAGYPLRWTVQTWIEGTAPHPDRLADPIGLAHDLANFVRAFRRIDLPDAPTAHRGGPLADQDNGDRRAIAQHGGEIADVWGAGLAGPDPDPTWVHGDLMPGNLLVGPDGRLRAVLDFAAVGLGDPACDLIVAWNLLPAPARDVFRDALDVDDATWARGRARALAIALIALPYYRHTHPSFAANAEHTIRASTE
ncbi:aminoglycoside phosphotransferase family protein [Cryptosporangium phraense]|uniref:Aminoglycoside phosphotransferase family protein n=1 Tax=Cryptosporangium phraense TaxID=2593070 RepID=A0A545AE66_9ACTN|nr:aminoglycoside phosphotransferase family protein [Cryptosporangium phraense]TQS39637.1 aminoglycoside phosphotransferase family protein [Cryptosporangium phraense]